MVIVHIYNIIYIYIYMYIYTYTGSVVQYWWRCTSSQYIGLFWGVPSSCVECHLLFSLVAPIVLLYDKQTNTSMLTTIGITFKQCFNISIMCSAISHLSGCFSLGPSSEYRIQHCTIGPLHVTCNYSTRIFYRGVLGFATDCPCGALCRGLTTCLLYVYPPFGNRLLNNIWAVGLA